eukprot:6665355-Prymnesium_polylepis.1
MSRHPGQRAQVSPSRASPVSMSRHVTPVKACVVWYVSWGDVVGRRPVCDAHPRSHAARARRPPRAARTLVHALCRTVVPRTVRSP